MPTHFSISHKTNRGGRRGRLQLPHYTVQTPVFMPVGTAGAVKAVPHDALESLGAELILGNTYHLYLRPGHESIRRMGGLHRFTSWKRALLTDSGGFQVFSLSDLRKVSEQGVEFRSHLDGSSHFFSPEHSMDVQIALGADIAMAFDECTEYPADRARADESLRLTMAWARRSLDHFRAHREKVPWFAERDGHAQSLFGIVQGGMYVDLRRECAERLVEMDFDGYAIGGLSVGEPRELTLEMIAAVLPLLPEDKPRYVMGVGYPDEIEMYSRMGVDMMDCVLPTRAARHGLLFTSEGRVNIKNRRYAEDQGPPDPACDCMVCCRYSRAYLRHLMHAAEPLSGTLNSIHNLAYYLGIMERVRTSMEGAAGGAPAQDPEAPRFFAGDRVRISDDFFWARGATGTISNPPSAVTAISGAWDSGLTRQEKSSLGKNTVYWVRFDQPQYDADGDGPYRGGQIWESALTILTDRKN